MFRGTAFQIGKIQLPAILLANKQVRDEATNPFYSLTAFRFWWMNDSQPRNKYFDRITRISGDQIAMITHLEWRKIARLRASAAAEKGVSLIKGKMVNTIETHVNRVGMSFRPGVLRVEYEWVEYD